MKLAATAINRMATARPITSTQTESLATPATASTLSSDIERSAITICVVAARKLMGAGADPSPAAAPGVAWGLRLSSRYIFQHTHNSKMPPASVKPTTASSCWATAAKATRRMTAPAIPQKITRLRSSGATRDAANPTMTALSPASTTSMTMTLMRAMRFSSNQSIMRTCRAWLPAMPVGGRRPVRNSSRARGAWGLMPIAAGRARPASALGELEAAAGFHLAVFLPLDDPAVTGEEAALLQHGSQLRFVVGERLGDAMAYRTGLTRQTAT